MNCAYGANWSIMLRYLKSTHLRNIFEYLLCARYCYQELRNHQGIKVSPFTGFILGVQMEKKKWGKKVGL